MWRASHLAAVVGDIKHWLSCLVCDQLSCCNIYYNSNCIATVRFACIKLCAGNWYKVGYHGCHSVFVQDDTSDTQPPVQGRLVLFFQRNCWWITTLHGEPPAVPEVRFIARGWREQPLLARDVCDFGDVLWSFPAWNRYNNPFVKMEPRLTHSLRADSTVLCQAADHLNEVIAELADCKAQLAVANAKVAALELAATAARSWQNYGAGASSSSSSTSWNQPAAAQASRWESKPKGGWLNKMVAMLAALWNDDQEKVKHLAKV